ncbi:MAG: uroporphyrinogen-III C-methyltransferase [Deltaproteobacteria bacterium]|nr:uroporphyrinogen-III C-methyltransferase [Deltaproteobacteria bacterium]
MKKGFVYLAGAGPGDPELITVKALNALAQADCIIYDFLANPALVEGYACEKIYVGKKGGDHTLPQEGINELIIQKAREGKTVVRLKGGDPFIFGRGGEEAEDLVEAGIPFAIIPGISSFYGAPAYAGIPVTHRDFAHAMEIITGHRREDAADGEDVNFPEYDSDRTFVFLMGVKNLAHITDSLINKKQFPQETPVALISWGTRPEQRVVTGTLQDIAAKVEKENIKPPSIIIVGGVVTLREKLRWFDNQPLFGKKIVVTRTRKQSSKLSQQLSRLGAAVIEFPTIEIQPQQDLSLLETAIRNLRDFAWLFFTSQNAVSIFFEKLFSMGLDARALGSVKIAAIGPATGDELIKYGLKPDLVPKEFVAESLLDAARSLKLAGSTVLLPCAREARSVLSDGLQQLGATVERINIYETVKPENREPETIARVQEADLITFTSSSTARNFFSLIPSVQAELASIGPITSQTIRELGYAPAFEAAEYTIDGLVKAITEHYANSPG